jgi:hypothetical protein
MFMNESEIRMEGRIEGEMSKEFFYFNHKMMIHCN